MRNIFISIIFSLCSACSPSFNLKPLETSNTTTTETQDEVCVESSKVYFTKLCCEKRSYSPIKPLLFSLEIKNKLAENLSFSEDGVRVKVDNKEQKILSKEEYIVLMEEWINSAIEKEKQEEARRIFGLQSGTGMFSQGTFPNDESNPIETQMDVERVQSLTIRKIGSLEGEAYENIQKMITMPIKNANIPSENSATFYFALNQKDLPENSQLDFIVQLGENQQKIFTFLRE